MSFEPDVHETQIAIIRYLLFKPDAGFAELQKATNLTSDHFNFHINKLIGVAYIEKSERRYALTAKGKDRKSVV